MSVLHGSVKLGLGCRAQAAIETIPLQERSGRDVRILVVDDFKPMRDSICDFLRGLGYEVLQACDAEEAMDIVRREMALDIAYRKTATIDVVLTDFEMPQMDGIALWNRIHSVIPTARVLFLTGHSSELFAKNVQLPGEVLSKPFDLLFLHEKLQALR